MYVCMYVLYYHQTSSKMIIEVSKFDVNMLNQDRQRKENKINMKTQTRCCWMDDGMDNLKMIFIRVLQEPKCLFQLQFYRVRYQEKPYAFVLQNLQFLFISFICQRILWSQAYSKCLSRVPRACKHSVATQSV